MSTSASLIVFASSSLIMSTSSSTATAIVQDNSLVEAFGYSPAQGAAVAAMVFFMLFVLLLSYQCTRYRYAYILPIAALLEFMGYYYRYHVVDNTTTLNIVLTDILILVTPNLLALLNYSFLSRILHQLPAKQHVPTSWRVPIITDENGNFIASRIGKFFVIADIVALLVQSSAATFLTSSDPSQVLIGQHIILAGLSWALAFIALFFYVTLTVFYSSNYSINDYPQSQTIRLAFYGLIGTITLLLIRAIYRLIDYAIGQHGYLNSHEAFFYIFDTTLILLCFGLYAFFPLGKYLTTIESAKTVETFTVVPQSVSIDIAVLSISRQSQLETLELIDKTISKKYNVSDAI